MQLKLGMGGKELQKYLSIPACKLHRDLIRFDEHQPGSKVWENLNFFVSARTRTLNVDCKMVPSSSIHLWSLSRSGLSRSKSIQAKSRQKEQISTKFLEFYRLTEARRFYMGWPNGQGDTVGSNLSNGVFNSKVGLDR